MSLASEYLVPPGLFQVAVREYSVGAPLARAVGAAGTVVVMAYSGLLRPDGVSVAFVVGPLGLAAYSFWLGWRAFRPIETVFREGRLVWARLLQSTRFLPGAPLHFEYEVDGERRRASARAGSQTHLREIQQAGAAWLVVGPGPAGTAALPETFGVRIPPGLER